LRRLTHPLGRWWSHYRRGCCRSRAGTGCRASRFGWTWTRRHPRQHCRHLPRQPAPWPAAGRGPQQRRPTRRGRVVAALLQRWHCRSRQGERERHRPVTAPRPTRRASTPRLPRWGRWKRCRRWPGKTPTWVTPWARVRGPSRHRRTRPGKGEGVSAIATTQHSVTPFPPPPSPCRCHHTCGPLAAVVMSVVTTGWRSVGWRSAGSLKSPQPAGAPPPPVLPAAT
jgi:hypothetical protein